MEVEERLPRRPTAPEVRLIVAGVLAAGAIAAILVFVLDTGSGPPPLPSTPVSLAAVNTGGAPGFRFVLAADVTIGARQIASVTDGAVAQHPSHDASLVTHTAGTTVATVLVYPYEYVQTRPASRLWDRIDIRAVNASLSLLGSPAAAEPADLIDLLRAAVTVTRVGSATVRRVATTRYHAVIALDRYRPRVPAAQRAAAGEAAAQLERLTGSTTLPVDVWIDAHRRVRRLALALSAHCGKLGAVSETVTMTLFDYAFQAPIAPPPRREVTDVTSTLGGQLTKGLESVGCH